MICLRGNVALSQFRIEKIVKSFNNKLGQSNESIKYLHAEYYTKVKYIEREISGMLMLFRKSTWKEVGKFNETGLLGIDNEFSLSVVGNGGKIGIMCGVYILHYYRLMEGYMYKDHLL